MSESDGEQAARSVALEQAYVHEVYEQCAEKTAQSRHWPRIYQFLEELEPGALVCDIGCGNGKYLSVNHSIFKVGVDRCKRFTDIAREKENEVLICDNLALPFRDESFDAVLSIAVVHHFATTERRVHALKELARVLRIGGRLVISVWAMEQRHRKFESQDVLVPWPKAYYVNASSDEFKCSGTSSSNEKYRDQNAQKYLSTSKRNSQRKCKSKSYWIDPIFSPSPSTSSLSSPNETCYSFFRRALQKLAGGRRGSGSRPWFLESWQNGSGKSKKNYEQDEIADVDELPIELRRVEEVSVMSKQSDSLSIKSKSLGDILEIQRLDLVRSRSSIPGLCSTVTSELNLDEQSVTSSLSSSKPRLVKQKSHFAEDVGLENPENTAIQELIKDLPDFQVASSQHSKRGNVLKQSSMNEELMSAERLEEKERVKRNIMKQASLNEEIICKRRTFESFKDSIYSGNATKKFQLLKSGLTNKIKQSTTNIEKVSSMSIKNGFVRILQGWKSTEAEVPPTSTVSTCDATISKPKTNDKVQPVTVIKREPEGVERRLSKEDGSDSSKDSSLQSDTSVDSEDSFASVIYVPKQDVPSMIDAISATPGYQLDTTSAPPSPRVKHPPDITNPRLKLISISPLLKQFPATSKSLPPPSPPGLSPRTLNSVTARPFFGSITVNTNQQQQQPSTTADKLDKFSIIGKAVENIKTNCQTSETKIGGVVETAKSLLDGRKPSLQAIRGLRSMSETVDTDEPVTTEDSAPLIPDDSPSEKTAQEKSSTESINEEESRKARLNQIKELLKQKPGFATRTKPSFPLVRRASTATTGRLETVTRVLPRLLSLELFNPETDDLDSDSSGVSSPESVGSVISVISDERYTSKKENVKTECNKTDPVNNSTETTNESKVIDLDGIRDLLIPKNDETETNAKFSASPQSLRLLEAAANVASSLEDAVGTAIQKAHSESYSAQIALETRSKSIIDDDIVETKLSASHSGSTDRLLPPVETTWNEECRQHLIDFTEKLSENLIHDIDQYCQKSKLEFSGSHEDRFSERYPFDPVPPYHTISKNSCKYNGLSNTIAWLDKTNPNEIEKQSDVDDSLIPRSTSDDIMDFVLVSNTGEFINEKENAITSEKQISAEGKECFRHGNSIESSDIGDSIENTISLSSGSQAESTGRLCSGSTVSLLSSNVDYGKATTTERRKFQTQGRSASEEMPPRLKETKRSTECLLTANNETLSESSSQESLPSDRGGGAITYHQYYHVFREGELDQLINKYVENLHIISSYYDHASWCIVAEKVQVWTI